MGVIGPKNGSSIFGHRAVCNAMHTKNVGEVVVDRRGKSGITFRVMLKIVSVLVIMGVEQTVAAGAALCDPLQHVPNWGSAMVAGNAKHQDSVLEVDGFVKVRTKHRMRIFRAPVVKRRPECTVCGIDRGVDRVHIGSRYVTVSFA